MKGGGGEAEAPHIIAVKHEGNVWMRPRGNAYYTAFGILTRVHLSFLRLWSAHALLSSRVAGACLPNSGSPGETRISSVRNVFPCSACMVYRPSAYHSCRFENNMYTYEIILLFFIRPSQKIDVV